MISDRGFSRQESGLGSQDILSEKPWKLKKNAGIIFTSGEKGNIQGIPKNAPFRILNPKTR